MIAHELTLRNEEERWINKDMNLNPMHPQIGVPSQILYGKKWYGETIPNLEPERIKSGQKKHKPKGLGKYARIYSSLSQDAI